MKDKPITLGDLVTTAQYYGIARDVPLMLSIDDGEVQHVAQVGELQIAGSGDGKALFLCANFDPRQSIVTLSADVANAFRTGRR